MGIQGAMSRVLLLMTTQSYRASAFLEAGRRIGVDLVVGGEQAQVLAPANPEGHLTVDFLDPEQAERAIVAFAREHPIDAVITADDEGAILAARAGRALGFRHNPPEAMAAARDKFRMRQILSRAGLPAPRF